MKKIFALFLILYIVQFSLMLNINADDDIIVSITDNYLEEIEKNDFYSLNTINILLSSNEIIFNKEYTIDDFKEVKCDSIKEIDEEIYKLIKDKPNTNLKYLKKIDFSNYHRSFVLKWDEELLKEEITEYVRLLNKREDVYIATYDYFYEFQNDDNQNSNTGETLDLSSNNWFTDCWKYTIGSNKVKVGIIDNGISNQYPDLVPQLNNSLHKDFTTEINPQPLVDNVGHGTDMARIIGSKGDALLGGSGICKNVALISLKVSNNGVAISSRVQDAIVYAIMNGIGILNFSAIFGQDEAPINDPIFYYQLSLYDGFFVCAAGNECNNNDSYPRYPANYSMTLDNVISVGGINCNYSIHSRSNYGVNSVSIYALYSFLILKNSTTLCLENCIGTSGSAAIVSGVAALLLSIDDSLNGEELKNLILNNSLSIPSYLGGLAYNKKILYPVGAIKSLIYMQDLDNIIVDSHMPTISVSQALNNTNCNSNIKFYSLEVLDHDEYQFNIHSTGSVLVNVFDADLNEITYYNIDDIGNYRFYEDLDEGIYYLKIQYNGTTSTTTYLDVRCCQDELLLFDSENEYLKNTALNMRFCFENLYGEGYYDITFVAYSVNNYEVELPDRCVKIFTDSTMHNILNTANIYGIICDAASSNGIDTFNTFLEEDTYYFDIEYNISDLYRFVILIEKVA